LSGPNDSLSIAFGPQIPATPAPGSFIIAGSGLKGAPATLDATLGLPLTSATIATSQVNYDTINLGTSDTVVTLVGSGLDTFSFGALSPTPNGLTINFSGETANQTLTFMPGTLEGTDTVLGGTGANDTVTSLNLIGNEMLTMTGVENYITSFVPGHATIPAVPGVSPAIPAVAAPAFDGTNVTGLLTLTAEQPGTAVAPITLNHMGFDFNTLTVDGVAGLTTVNYTHDPAAMLTVNYDEMSPIGPFLTNFLGLAVTNVTDVWVNFANGASLVSPFGAISLDNKFTTTLTLDNSGNYTTDQANISATVYLTESTGPSHPLGDAALTNLDVRADGSFATMSLVDGPYQSAYSELIPISINSVLVEATNLASGAYINGAGGTDPAVDIIGGGIVTLTVDTGILGTFATAEINTAPSLDPAVFAAGPIGTINVHSDGYKSNAIIIGGEGGVANGQTDFPIILGPAGINLLEVTANGTGSLAEITTYPISPFEPLDVLGFAGVATSGYIHTLNVQGLGANSDAHISGGEFGVVAFGAIGSVLVSAANTDAVAYIAAGPEGEGAGLAAYNYTDIPQQLRPIDQYAIHDITVSATGQGSIADISGFFGVEAFGQIASVLVSADATLSSASIVGDEVGLWAAQNIASIVVNATMVDASAFIEGTGDATGIVVIGGGIGFLTIDASGQDSNAWVSGSDNSDGYGVDVFGPNSDINTLNVLATNTGASAWIYGGFRGVYISEDLTGTLTVNASGPSSYAAISTDTSSGDIALYIGGDANTIVVQAGGGLYHGAGINEAFIGTDFNSNDGEAAEYGMYVRGHVVSLTVQASGTSSFAYIGNYSDDDGSHGGNYIGGNLGTLLVDTTAGGVLGIAHLYDTYVGGTIGSITVEALGYFSEARAHISTGLDTAETSPLNVAGPITLLAAGTGGPAVVDFNYQGELALTTVSLVASAGANLVAGTPADQVNFWLDLAQDNYSGVLMAGGHGNVFIQTYGQSFVSLDASANTGTVDLLVHNADDSSMPMTIWTGAGHNFIQVGSSSGTLAGTDSTGANSPGSDPSTINITAGSHTVIDLSNQDISLYPANAGQATLIVNGFVNNGTDIFSFGFTTDTTNGEWNGSQGVNFGTEGLVTGNAVFPSAVANMVALAENIYFPAGDETKPEWVFAYTESGPANNPTDTGYLMYNGGSGDTVKEIIQLNGVTSFNATLDIHGTAIPLTPGDLLTGHPPAYYHFSGDAPT
jgi:hypothetical protein